jgi:thioredoxin-like negative regulator of GroEL
MSKFVRIFTSPTCAPCRQLKPELEFQAQQRGFTLDKVELAVATQDVFAKFGVRAVPVTMLMDGETEVDRFVGPLTPSGVEAKLAEWGL